MKTRCMNYGQQRALINPQTIRTVRKHVTAGTLPLLEWKGKYAGLGWKFMQLNQDGPGEILFTVLLFCTH